MLTADDIKDLITTTLTYKHLSYNKIAALVGLNTSTFAMRLRAAGLTKKKDIAVLVNYVTFIKKMLSASALSAQDLHLQAIKKFEHLNDQIFNLAILALNLDYEIIYKCTKTKL